MTSCEKAKVFLRHRKYSNYPTVIIVDPVTLSFTVILSDFKYYFSEWSEMIDFLAAGYDILVEQGIMSTYVEHE